MMKFMEVKTDGGNLYLVNAAEVTFVKALDGDWDTGVYVGFSVNASDYKGIRLDPKEGRRFREWLQSL